MEDEQNYYSVAQPRNASLPVLCNCANAIVNVNGLLGCNCIFRQLSNPFHVPDTMSTFNHFELEWGHEV